jgi:hypothetical protein
MYIIVEVEESGKEHFYVQKKYFYILDLSNRKKDISMNTYRIRYDTIVDANICIKNQVNDYLKSKKIKDISLNKKNNMDRLDDVKKKLKHLDKVVLFMRKV